MSQVISTFLTLQHNLQFEVLAAAQREAFYIPRNPEATKAAAEYWSTSRKGAGSNAVFTARIAMPHESEPAYVLNKSLTAWLKRLYVGGDITPYQSMDFTGGGSTELEAILAENVANDEPDVELDGVLKCEAMGFLIRHGLGTMSNPVGMVDGDPFVGVITLTLSPDFIKHMKTTEGYSLVQFAKDHPAPALAV